MKSKKARKILKEKSDVVKSPDKLKYTTQNLIPLDLSIKLFEYRLGKDYIIKLFKRHYFRDKPFSKELERFETFKIFTSEEEQGFPKPHILDKFYIQTNNPLFLRRGEEIGLGSIYTDKPDFILIQNIQPYWAKSDRK